MSESVDSGPTPPRALEDKVALARLRAGSEPSLTGRSRLPLGEIYLKVDDQALPAEGWTDFVLPVARSWIDAIGAIASGSPTAHVEFMDGPFHVNLERASHISIRMVCVERRRDVELVAWSGSAENRTIGGASAIDASLAIAEMVVKLNWQGATLWRWPRRQHACVSYVVRQKPRS